MTRKTKGLLSILVPVVAWGISFVSTEFLLAVLGPMTIGAIRFVIATALLYVAMKVTKQPLKIKSEDRFLFLLAGGVGIGLYFFFENTGIKYISASPAALIIAAIPVFTLIFEALIYKRKIEGLDLFAVLLSVFGVVFIVDIKFSEFFKMQESIGYLMMVGAVFAWVIYSLASKPLFEKYSYLTIIFYQFLYSIPFFIPLVFFESNRWHAIGFEVIAHLIFLSIIASVLGFYCYAKAMDLLGVTESSIFINFLPIVTIIFSYFYLGTVISVRQFIGGALVLASVTITTLHGQHVQRRKEQQVVQTELEG
ncbi:DMT family transporter [Fusibacter sp. 3D3]|uniref:DMT family transporter n=1 Tax=Fusibacter sp. 3D3 TaxID=1048380 RepID=UPI000852C6C8|nr:DMT family transporter [Fusibacter sp. 3D3]GAU75473.1 permease of the drug/metabolite transporter DMT superfamily [Fusibacter sp. 3D3]